MNCRPRWTLVRPDCRPFNPVCQTPGELRTSGTTSGARLALRPAQDPVLRLPSALRRAWFARRSEVQIPGPSSLVAGPSSLPAPGSNPATTNSHPRGASIVAEGSNSGATFKVAPLSARITAGLGQVAPLFGALLQVGGTHTGVMTPASASIAAPCRTCRRACQTLPGSGGLSPLSTSLTYFDTPRDQQNRANPVIGDRATFDLDCPHDQPCVSEFDTPRACQSRQASVPGRSTDQPSGGAGNQVGQLTNRSSGDAFSVAGGGARLPRPGSASPATTKPKAPGLRFDVEPSARHVTATKIAKNHEEQVTGFAHFRALRGANSAGLTTTRMVWAGCFYPACPHPAGDCARRASRGEGTPPTAPSGIALRTGLSPTRHRAS